MVEIDFYAGDTIKAETLTGKLIKLGYRLEAATIASLISLYAKQHDLKKAQEVFAAVADSSTNEKLIYKSMIDAYSKCGKPEEAYSLYKQLAEEGHDLDAVTISIVVNALTNSGMSGKLSQLTTSLFLSQYILGQSDKRAFNNVQNSWMFHE
jgi:pentatricopeptide repeat protein